MTEWRVVSYKSSAGRYFYVVQFKHVYRSWLFWTKEEWLYLPTPFLVVFDRYRYQKQCRVTRPGNAMLLDFNSEKNLTSLLSSFEETYLSVESYFAAAINGNTHFNGFLI